MRPAKIAAVIEEFVAAAKRAQQAGFDGVQLHAAHGYLIHQFLSPHVNTRRDAWGQDRFAFLRNIITGIRSGCGPSYPIFAKISAGDGYLRGVTPALAAQYAGEMEREGVAALEVSFGTMDEALNIFRGAIPNRSPNSST